MDFEVGARYENRNFSYVVLSVDGDSMHVRLEDGSSRVLGVALQARIIENMSREPPPRRAAGDFEYQSRCWRCRWYILGKDLERCDNCGWYRCAGCGACGCEHPKGRRAAFLEGRSI